MFTVAGWSFQVEFLLFEVFLAFHNNFSILKCIFMFYYCELLHELIKIDNAG